MKEIKKIHDLIRNHKITTLAKFISHRQKKTRVKHVFCCMALTLQFAHSSFLFHGVSVRATGTLLAAGCAEKDVSARAQFVCDVRAERKKRGGGGVGLILDIGARVCNN